MKKNISTFIECDNEYEESKLVLFGAPFDGTTSFRPGTRFGPSAIRNESFGIETYSPYSDLDLVDYKIFDMGDIDLPFGNTKKALDIIYKKTKQVLNDNKIPFMIGGEHLVALASVRAVYEKYPDLHLIQLDAHTDLRDEYLGEALSHSTVIKQIWKFLGDNKIYQYGIRSGEKYEFEFAKNHTFLHKFDLEGLDKTIDDLDDKPVYITLDLDVLDPSIFPGTGTPEAGGVSFKELLEVILSFHKLNIVGLDINELSPHYDISGVSTAVACKLVRELILQVYKSDKTNNKLGKTNNK